MLKEGRLHGLFPGWVVGHLAVYAGFFWVTKWLIEGISRPGDQNLRVIAWICCGVAVLVSWCLAALPVRSWVQVVRQGWPVLLAGSVVGIFALSLGDSTGKLWDSLHSLTFRSAQGVLRMVAQDVVCHPEAHELGIGDFVVAIAPACSGFEGIGLICALLGAYVLLFRKDLRFPQALLLLPLGMVVIWSFNVLRIVLLVIVGASGRPDVALGGFHSQAGWLGFNIVGLGLVATSRRFRWFSRVDATGQSRSLDTEVANPTAAYLGPMLAIIATTMITGAMSNGQFDALYPARVAAAGLAFWLLRRGYSGLSCSWSWPAVGIGVVVFALWVALEPLYATATAESTRTIPRALAGMPIVAAAAWLFFRVFGAVVMVPLAEELAFRGYPCPPPHRGRFRESASRLLRMALLPDFLTSLRSDAPSLGGRNDRGHALRPDLPPPGPPGRRGAGPRHDKRPDRRPCADHRGLDTLVSLGFRAVNDEATRLSDDPRTARESAQHGDRGLLQAARRRPLAGPRVLAAQDPDLADELNRFFESNDRVEWLITSVVPAVAAEGAWFGRYRVLRRISRGAWESCTRPKVRQQPSGLPSRSCLPWASPTRATTNGSAVRWSWRRGCTILISCPSSTSARSVAFPIARWS